MEPRAPRYVATCLLAAFILSATIAEAKGPTRSVQTASQWLFDQSCDQNYDNWPDNWRRRQGRDYPAYLPIAIVPKDPALMESALRADHQLKPIRRIAKKLGAQEFLFSESIVDRYLRIQLNGGAAVVQSPPVQVSDIYSYRVSGAISTRGLKHNKAWLEYLFLDSSGKTISAKASRKFSGDTEWTYLHLKPTGPPVNATTMIVRLHLEPSGKSDVFGEAGFDNIRVESLPQLRISTDNPNGLYANHDRPLATCHVSGLARPVTGLRFSLHDPHGHQLAQFDTQLDHDNAKTVAKSWQLPPLEAGFYRVHADLYDGETKTHSTEASLAVLEDLPRDPSPFGWTLGTGHDPITRRDLPNWLEKCRVGWIKYPCWLNERDAEGADDLAWLLEHLSDRGIESVGMLDQPPEVSRDHTAPQREPLAPLLREPEDWRPRLEALMTRLSMRTTWWQIGGESDYSFLGQPNLPKTVDDIRRELQGFGQPIQVSIPWPWLEPLPKSTHGGWKAVSLAEEQPYTASELDVHLDQLDEEAFETWITLDPLDASRYRLRDRIRDLIARMLSVRRHQVPIAFVSNPFDPKLAFLNRDATPNEMLLPWRTTASLIGSLNHQGAMRLPQGSENVVMANASRAVLVVWNNTPTEERLFLGKNAKQVDVWGRITDIPSDAEGRQIVSVDSLPKFLVDLDYNVTMFRLAAVLDNTRLQSLPGRTQSLSMRIANPYRTSLAGKYTLSAPVSWETERQARSINVEESGHTNIPVNISLRSNASIGRELLRFDFTLDLDRPTQFSVWRDIDVGPEDIEIDPSIRFDAAGNLIVRVSVNNLSNKQQQFNFYMLSKSRRHQRIQASVPPRQHAARDFTWENGKELLGETLTLQAEDRNSARLLIYPIRIEQ